MSWGRILRSPAWRGVWLGAVCALAVWLITVESGLLRGLEDWMLDGCFFYRGRIAEQGTPEKIFTNPENERTQAFLRAVLDAG